MPKSLSDVKEGETVFLMPGYSNKSGHEERVSKVTRTHIHLTNGSRFQKADGYQTGTEYTPGRIYASKQDYDDLVRLLTKWHTFSRGLPNRMPEDMTESELDMLMARFNLAIK